MRGILYAVLRIDFVTLFPEMVVPHLSHSILGRGSDSGLLTFRLANPRDFTYDRHQKVDDSPYGGEPGMLIKAEPVALAIEWLSKDAPQGERTAIVMTDPAGATFDQSAAGELASFDRIVFLCGHYEGFDHRIHLSLATHTFSIGDYVLTNGEVPAIVMADCAARLVPGVLGSSDSLEADSHAQGLLSAPNYTKPPTWRGLEVPEVLLSGDHAAIRKWRRETAIEATRRYRPGLIDPEE